MRQKQKEVDTMMNRHIKEKQKINQVSNIAKNINKYCKNIANKLNRHIKEKQRMNQILLVGNNCENKYYFLGNNFKQILMVGNNCKT